jgi:hypothetical protein
MIGIYFLKDGDDVVYVGKSKNIEKRVEWHRKSGKVFDSYKVAECDQELLDSAEVAYIRAFNPKYNIHHKLDKSNTPDGYIALSSCGNGKTLIAVSNDTRDHLMRLKNENGLASVDEVIRRLLKRLKSRSL